MKRTARQILGDDDFEYLRKEVLEIKNNPCLSNTDRAIEYENLLEAWDLDTDYLNEFLKS